MKRTFSALFLILGFFACAPAFASGKIILGGTSYFLSDEHKIGPMVGLSVYEKLQTNVAINSWVGYGIVEREMDSPRWLNTSHFVEFYLGRLTLGVGYKGNYNPDTEELDQGVAGKLAWKLWD